MLIFTVTFQSKVKNLGYNVFYFLLKKKKRLRDKVTKPELSLHAPAK